MRRDEPRHSRATCTCRWIVAVAMILGACSGEFSSDPADYMPDKVDGREVHAGGGYAESLQRAFAAGGHVERSVTGIVGDVSARTPRTPRTPLPELVVIALAGQDLNLEVGSEHLGLILGNATGGSDVTSREVDGVAVHTLALPVFPGAEGFVSYAAPTGDVGIVAIGFGGDSTSSEKAIEAMLHVGHG